MGIFFKVYSYAHPFIKQSNGGLFWLYLFIIPRREEFKKNPPFIPQSLTSYTQGE